MNLADAAQLLLTLSIKDEVSSGLRNIQGALDATNTKGGSLQGGLTKIGQGLGVGIKNTAKIGALGLGALWTQVDAGIDSLVELEDVTHQTEAVIKSTGSSAGLTADDIRTLAQRYEDLSGVDDKVVQSGENVLLTFKNIKSDAFEPALASALDMSQAMGTDLQSAILQVGKALNDPVDGLSALKRVGVTFDDETEKIIKNMVETGDTAGAQKIIIQELNDEFGGSAQASMEGYRGTQLRLKDTWEDLQQTLATALLPSLKKLGDKLDETLKDPKIKDQVKKLGDAIAGLFSDENIESGAGAIKELFTFLKDLPWESIKSGMQFAADNAKKVVDVFRSLPPGVQAGLLTFLAANKLTGGLVASGLGELAKVALSSLKTITAANVTVIGANVTGGGIPGAGGAASGAAGTAAGVGARTLLGAAGFLGFVGLSVKGDTPLPVSANTLEQHARDLDAQIEGLTSSIDRDMLGFLRSDADTQALRDQRAQASLEYLRLLPDLPGWEGTETANKIREWAKPVLDAQVEAARIVKLIIDNRLAAIQASGLVNNGMTSDQRSELQRINNSTMPGIRAVLGVGNVMTAEQRSELVKMNNTVLPGIKTALGLGNQKTDDQNAELDRITNYTRATSQKDLSIDVTVKSQVNLSGREIATWLDHYAAVSGVTR